ncbi:MAG: LicC protein, partial [Microgenomates group bacterium GW2011_GWC1_39_7]
MKALITSAGLGSRIPELKNTNKSLIKIGNKTLISRAIDSLNSHGIRDIYVITGHNAEKVENEIAGRATPIFN